MLKRIINVLKGGPGSGHFDHPGRPPEVGGSAPSRGGGSAGKGGKGKGKDGKKTPKLSSESKKKIKANQAIKNVERVKDRIDEVRAEVKSGGRDNKGRFVSTGRRLQEAASKIGASDVKAEVNRVVQRVSSKITPGDVKGSAVSINAGLNDLNQLANVILQRAKEIV